MKLLVTYFLAVGLIAIAVQETCIFDKLDTEDGQFCRVQSYPTCLCRCSCNADPSGDLEIFYPQLGDVGCTYIPRCNQYRKQISKEWSSPNVRYSQADKITL